MYTPAHFEETCPDKIAALIESAPLGCIVAQTEQGLIANHIPLFISRETTLIGHLALANDMHRLIDGGQEVLVIFKGEDAYVSPNFYPTKQENPRHAPTWNYQVVHVYGNITFQHTRRAKLAAVGLLTRKHERQLNGVNAWKMSDAPADYNDQMLARIVAFRIEISRVIAKSKLSQNREARDYVGVIDGLRANGQNAMADKMADYVS